MDSLLINGGNDITGSVKISGFKHALVPILAASLIVNGKLTIQNVPDIEDNHILRQILTFLGSKITLESSSITIDTADVIWRPIPEILSRQIHGSLYLIPCLLGRLGFVEIGQTGGCQIGDPQINGLRPIHHIVSVLERFGSQFSEVKPDLIRGTCSGFNAAHIDIRDYSDSNEIVNGPLVSGATKTALLAAAIAKGTSIIEYPYRKPDVTELLAFLTTSGVQVQDQGHRVIIEGCSSLRGCKHNLISDLIEIITFVTASVYLRCPLDLEAITTERVKISLAPELECLTAMGVDLQWQENKISVHPPDHVKGIDIEVTSQSIYSDNHPFFTLMLLSADRPSCILEKVWLNRFDYAHQLVRLGACLDIKTGMVKITPKRPFRTGLKIRGADTRSAAVLLLASLGLKGTTILEGVTHLKRGSDNFVGKLQNLGANIRQID